MSNGRRNLTIGLVGAQPYRNESGAESPFDVFLEGVTHIPGARDSHIESFQCLSEDAYVGFANA